MLRLAGRCALERCPAAHTHARRALIARCPPLPNNYPCTDPPHPGAGAHPGSLLLRTHLWPPGPVLLDCGALPLRKLPHAVAGAGGVSGPRQGVCWGTRRPTAARGRTSCDVCSRGGADAATLAVPAASHLCLRASGTCVYRCMCPHPRRPHLQPAHRHRLSHCHVPAAPTATSCMQLHALRLHMGRRCAADRRLARAHEALGPLALAGRLLSCPPPQDRRPPAAPTM